MARNILLSGALAACCLLAFMESVSAQGTAFIYQGHFIDSGAPANGSYDLEFTLYDSSSNGVMVGAPVSAPATGVSNGLFTVTLDFGAQFAGANRWLEIDARTNGGTVFSPLLPRQPILPVPDAVYAASAGNAVLAATATAANEIGSIPSGDVAQLNVPDTTVQATGTIVLTAGFVTGINLTDGGSGYASPPLVTVIDPSGSNVLINATVANGSVSSLAIQNAGKNYSTNAVLLIAPPPSNARQTFGTANTFTGVNTITNSSNAFAGTFNGGFGTLSGGAVTLSNSLTLPATTAAGGIIYLGGSSILHAFGTNNFFAGSGAGNLSLVGIDNTGVGVAALQSDTVASYVTAVGHLALNRNTTGSNNTATGWGALQFNTTGTQNTANGMQALRFNTANNNTAFGFDALLENTTGNQNTGIGAGALLNNVGGAFNTAIGYNALVDNITGQNNTAIGCAALQLNSSGIHNTATGYEALFSNTNGEFNSAHGYQALFANTSGSNNTANGDWALNLNTIGSQNTAIGHQALNLNTTGSNNTALGDSALHNMTNGINNIALGVQAGSKLTNVSNNIEIGHVGVSSDNNVTRIGTPGVQSNAFIAGVITGDGSGLTNLPAAGSGNTIQAGATLSDIGGGVSNSISASGSFATIGGGTNNSASGYEAVIGGGANNIASAVTAFVGGGYFDIASGPSATVGGGDGNKASGYGATVPGGFGNVASGDYSFAAGLSAQATNNNSFVWSDGSTNTTTTSSNQFVTRASGGAIFYSSTNTTAGVLLAAGSGAWNTLSDRNAKNGLTPVDALSILAEVSALPISRWSYKTEQGVRHVGPMAQDFYAAFRVGENDTSISTVDEEGVALAAIQGLNQKLNEKDAEIQQLKQSVAELKAMIMQGSVVKPR